MLTKSKTSRFRQLTFDLLKFTASETWASIISYMWTDNYFKMYLITAETFSTYTVYTEDCSNTYYATLQPIIIFVYSI